MTPSTTNADPAEFLASQVLQDARAKIASLRMLLLNPSPENLEAQLPALESAARSLELLKTEASPESARGDLEALARDLRSCARLIEHGMSLNRAWAGILASAAAGYSHRGEPAALRAETSISLRG